MFEMSCDLSLNINLEYNDLDFELAKSIGEYFKLNPVQQEEIIKEIRKMVIEWPQVAKKNGNIKE